ncbi:DsbA family protein [Pontibacter harenae]|uniref:DsbA family protein n=1 Tax=Pontibacter harenae TaxID=2894083 RepID=UPI001E5E9A73|nr:DsbA family protein [Pontibacter harenae]MCC9166834.1 DsbA family protein [Pontibacter harenae]
MQNNLQNPTLLYITNPMCNWCYGFTPVVRRLNALWQGRLNIRVLLAPFQAHAKDPVSADEKERLAVAWHRVQERTNQPFDYRIFTKKNAFVYNTEPACRALLCVRLLRPVLTLEVLRAMHSAFYADGKDLTDVRELVKIAGLFGISENLFLTLYESDEVIAQLEDEFNYVHNLGVTSFPSIYIETTHGPEPLTKGYFELHELEERLLKRLSQVTG